LARVRDPGTREATIDTTTFRGTLHLVEPPAELSLALQTLWWDAKDDWTRAHECAQRDEGKTGASVHAYLHRKEGDLSNARYWYNRAGRPPATVSLDAEWEALVRELLAA
jgi:hypothetical protein